MLNLHQVETVVVRRRNSLQLVEKVQRLKAAGLRRSQRLRRSRRTATTAWRRRRSSNDRGS